MTSALPSELQFLCARLSEEMTVAGKHVSRSTQVQDAIVPRTNFALPW